MHLRTFYLSSALLSLCLPLILLPGTTSAAKILTVALISAKSHKITYERLLHELAGRGHEITVLSPIVSSKQVKNVREILTIDAEKYMEELQRQEGKKMNLFDIVEKDETVNPFTMLDIFGEICKKSYDLPQVKELMKEKFDLIILSAVFNECAAGFVYKFNTSIILVSPLSAPTWVTSILGGPSPPSFVPNVFMSYTDTMNFYQRTTNFLSTFGLKVIQDYSYKPFMEAIYREKLNDLSIPSSDDILKNASLVLSNGHFTLGRPRPFLPDVIEVGGMHCRPSEALPKVSSKSIYLAMKVSRTKTYNYKHKIIRSECNLTI